MFYDGTLQDGISTAVGQQKLVLCFVTDEKEESQQWETDFLKDESIQELIAHEAIALRLLAGSEEAGYLAQIFPLPKTPTVVLIKNGDLKEYLTSGTSREDFMRRFMAAFNKSAQNNVSSPAQDSSTISQSPPTAGATPHSTPQQEQRSSNVQRVLAERAARLQAQKEKAERKAKEDRARAKEQARAEAQAGIDSERARSFKQAEIVKKKRQQETEERKRILQRIEDDRAERRNKAAEREKARREELAAEDMSTVSESAPEEKIPSTTKIGDMTAIQVRLFDGSTLRSRFKTESTVRDLRSWVDSHSAGGNYSYRFKQMLRPLPNRDIDETEEDKDLGTLGLAPSSTLVLVPVHGSASAFAGGSASLFGTIIAMILRFFSAILGAFGFGAQGSAESESSDMPTVGAASGRVSGAQNDEARRRRNQQLYNGNSTNFEPQPDDEDDR